MILNCKVKDSCAGQSLVEVIIGLAIGALLIGAAVFAISFMLRSSNANQKFQIAAGLNQETIDKVRVVASADWNALYNLIPKGQDEGAKYYATSSGSRLIINPISQGGPIVIEGTSYSSFVYVENICRNDSGVIIGVTDNNGAGYTCTSTPENDNEDPSTQKITVITTWTNIGGGTSEVKLVDYITRWQNTVFHQTDWVGGPDWNRGAVSSTDDIFATSSSIDFFSSSGLIKLQGF